MHDGESKTIKKFKHDIFEIKKYLEILSNLENDLNKKTILFNKYKNDYISSMSSVELDIFELDELKNKINLLVSQLEKKVENINIISHP